MWRGFLVLVSLWKTCSVCGQDWLCEKCGRCHYCEDIDLPC